MRTVLVVLVLGLVAACSPSVTSPSRPSDTPGPPGPSGPSGPSVTSLTIGGQTSSGGANSFGAWLGLVPGETAFLTATARFSDNTERDVTADAVWTADDLLGVATIVSPGTIRAGAPGWATVAASYGGPMVRAEAQLRVAPGGVFLLGVAVDDGRSAMADALVQVTSPAGTFNLSTGFWGIVYLPAIGETAVQVEKAGYVTDRKSVTVSADDELEFTLRPSASVGSDGSR